MRRATRRWIVAGGALLGFFGGLAACENTVQRQRAATCRRALPAVAEAGRELRLLRVGTGAVPDSVRVDYADGRRPHWILCRFGPGTDLVGLTTEKETLTGAALYMLKRFYLDTPDAAVGDPGG